MREKTCKNEQVAQLRIKKGYNGWNNKEEYAGSEDPVGIASPLDEAENETIYNFSGQLISKPQRGINIVGGKKVLVK